MALAKDNEVIQTLAFKGTEPCFGVGVEVGGADRQTNCLDAIRFENRIKLRGVLAVAIVQNITSRFSSVLEMHAEVPCVLLNPRGLWMFSTTGVVNAPRTGVNKEEKINHAKTREGENGLGAEVGCPQGLFVSAQERPPCVMRTIRSIGHARRLKNARHCSSFDETSEFESFPPLRGCSPSRYFHAQGE